MVSRSSKYLYQAILDIFFCPFSLATVPPVSMTPGILVNIALYSTSFVANLSRMLFYHSTVSQIHNKTPRFLVEHSVDWGCCLLWN